MNQIRYSEKITYKRTGKILISVDEILQHLQRAIHPGAEAYENFFICFFIPEITISGVNLWIQNYRDSALKGYEISMCLPCSIEDLKILHAIIEFVEDKCRNAGLHIQMNFDYHSNYPGKSALEKDKIYETWKNLSRPFCKLNVSEKPFEFLVSNGRLEFLLSSNDYQAIQFNQFQHQFLPSIRNYIWQDQYKFVQAKRYYTSPEKNNIPAGPVVTLAEWSNTNPVLIGKDNYVIFCNNGRWVAVRPQKWKKILSPYFEQYDLTEAHLFPVIAENLYNELKDKLAQYPSSLQLDCVTEDGIKKFHSIVVVRETRTMA
jgi:hypothetical protein